MAQQWRKSAIRSRHARDCRTCVPGVLPLLLRSGVRLCCRGTFVNSGPDALILGKMMPRWRRAVYPARSLKQSMFVRCCGKPNAVRSHDNGGCSQSGRLRGDVNSSNRGVGQGRLVTVHSSSMMPRKAVAPGLTIPVWTDPQAKASYAASEPEKVGGGRRWSPTQWSFVSGWPRLGCL
jgi:hypothetical protein